LPYHPRRHGDAEDAVAAARRALAEWGTIDILVNNAGITRLAPATDLTLGQWDEVMAVNLRAPLPSGTRTRPAMIEQRWGKVVDDLVPDRRDRP
jgi:NAD(P)-dependent dehydrogenase (short-subunit alcohol dehydrogenase family)